MCQLSPKLQLCTCATNGSMPKNYWVLYRFNKQRNMMVIGEVLIPAYIHPDTDAYNTQLLTQLLNDGNVFDVDISPKPKDGLLLSFSVANQPNTTERIDYGFQYQEAKWLAIPYDVFDWGNQYEEAANGKIIEGMADGE